MSTCDHFQKQNEIQIAPYLIRNISKTKNYIPASEFLEISMQFARFIIRNQISSPFGDFDETFIES